MNLILEERIRALEDKNRVLEMQIQNIHRIMMDIASSANPQLMTAIKPVVIEKPIDKDPPDESLSINFPDYCVYFITEVPFTNKVKIGKTGNLSQRLITLQTGSATHLDVAGCINTRTKEEMTMVETTLHRSFRDNWLHGEWYEMNLEEVKRLCDDEYLPELDERVKPEVNKFANRDAKITEWVLVNPPEERERTTVYYSRYSKTDPRPVATNIFGPIVRKCGYADGGANNAKYWIKL